MPRIPEWNPHCWFRLTGVSTQRKRNQAKLVGTWAIVARWHYSDTGESCFGGAVHMRHRKGGLLCGIREEIGLTRIKGAELRRRASSIRQSRLVGTSRLDGPSQRWQDAPKPGGDPRSSRGIMWFYLLPGCLSGDLGARRHIGGLGQWERLGVVLSDQSNFPWVVFVCYNPGVLVSCLRP